MEKNKKGTKIGKFKFGRLNVERYNFELKQIMEEMTTEKHTRSNIKQLKFP